MTKKQLRVQEVRVDARAAPRRRLEGPASPTSSPVPLLPPPAPFPIRTPAAPGAATPKLDRA